MNWNVVKIISLTAILTGLGSCSAPISSFYSAKSNGLATSAEESAKHASSTLQQLDVNNRELAAVTNQTKLAAESAESAAASLRNKK